ncbi:hypothetical protein Esti_004138 [Eimeria stiedai]
MQDEGRLNAPLRAVWLRAAQNSAYDGDYYVLTADETVPISDGEDRHPSRAAQGRRAWKLLWIPAMALLVALAAKAYIKRSSRGGEVPALAAQFDGQQLKGGDEFITARPSSSLMGEVPYTEVDTRREFHMHAPLLPQGDQPFGVDASLRPRTVPFVLGGQAGGDETLGPRGLPGSWLSSTDKHPPLGPVLAASSPQEPGEFDWLEMCQLPQHPAAAEKQGTPQQQHHQVPSSEAFALARRLDWNVDAGALPLAKEDTRSALKRRNARVLAKMNSSQVEGFLQTMMAANDVRSTSWNAVSRSLRAERLVADVANDLLRVQERQEEAMRTMQQAAQQLEASREGPQAEAAEKTQTEALAQYRSLLVSEQLLLSNLLVHTGCWKTEVERLLTNVASVLSSDSFKDIEAIGECQGYFGLGKASFKVVSMTTSVSKETRSKIRALHITDLVNIRLEESKYRLMHADTLGAPDVLAKLASFKERAKAAREEGRKNLAKKKASSWFLDVDGASAKLSFCCAKRFKLPPLSVFVVVQPQAAGQGCEKQLACLPLSLHLHRRLVRCTWLAAARDSGFRWIAGVPPLTMVTAAAHSAARSVSKKGCM